MKQKKLITFRMREQDYEELKKIADKNERTYSELIRIILERFIENEKNRIFQ